jgi:putative DNA-invertase from lambdoid prophage Rac
MNEIVLRSIRFMRRKRCSERLISSRSISDKAIVCTPRPRRQRPRRDQENWQENTSLDVGSGATARPKPEALTGAARRREIDLLVWRLDRWRRSLVDLVSTLQELSALEVGFVPLSEALDLTTPSGRALTGMLAVFAEFEGDILRDRVKAGIAQARIAGKLQGRPKTAARFAPEMRLRKQGLSKRAIAKRLSVSRTSVIRLLRPQRRG